MLKGHQKDTSHRQFTIGILVRHQWESQVTHRALDFWSVTHSNTITFY